MGTVRYTTINGEVVAELRNGVRSLYVPDSLGTTRALLSNTQTQTDTFVAWPYGETVHLTGSNPTPFTFVGTQGYHTDSPSRIYVRNRVEEPEKGRWLTEDIIMDSLNAYLYGYANPIRYRDPSGLIPTVGSMSQAPTVTNYTYQPTGGISAENANGALVLLSNVFDNENRLLVTQFSNNTISTYTYSGDGLRRTSNEQGGGPTSIIWDGTDALMDLS